MPGKQEDVTQLLIAYSQGRPEAFDELFPLVYDALCDLARRHLRHERPGHTLNTAGLVHECYLRLVDQTQSSWQDRSHFFAAASKAMRRLLVDHARQRKAQKRGGGARHVPFEDHLVAVDAECEQLLALDQALNRLAEHHERLGTVVECRFFAGMTLAETAEALRVSVRTVERDWTRAKVYLYRTLHPLHRETPP